MNFREFQERTQEFLSELTDPRAKPPFSGFWDFLNELNKPRQQYFAQTMKEQVSAQGFEKAHQLFVSNVKVVTQQANWGDMFVGLNRYLETVRSAKNRGLPPRFIQTRITDLSLELKEIWQSLNDLIHRPNSFPLITKIFDHVDRIDKIFVEIQHFNDFLLNAEKIIDEKQQPGENCSSLNLEFSHEIKTVADLNFKLNSLQVIYSETCLLFGINEKQFPLVLSKAESGSLWCKVFGESKVIEFMSWFLKNSIRFLHRKFTIEGQLQRIPMAINTLDSELQLLKKLKDTLPEKQYADLTKAPSETLAKTVALITKYTQNLLERETRVKIDSEVIELTYSEQQKYLKAVKKLLPEHIDFRVLESEEIESSRAKKLSHSKTEKANSKEG